MKTVSPLFKTLIIPAMLLLGACGSEKEVAVAPPPPPPPAVVPVLGDVFFDFDKSDIRTDAVDQLKTNAQWLQANPSQKVVVEGHCDNRGTAEYNLALGERRAAAARDFVVNLGTDAARVKTVSYGEERPFAQGNTEEAWAQNRRAHFVGE
ncbi:peptidoglycan-associated lipoprotein Pal [Chlorobium sp. BLA1]|uniref:peptidoglycan-associated lipoprotein Pal n=1 Tax=Candidatus Chlorobium masyuteum TaxID=2716876 RepID=UPI001420BC1A|nr:peptidoglycan-associated lipoprotein Pal [Candidatus Chlorobium masyuteum]NHQ60791.1 peptidoglycan-associated lipoprotein Pal [Candidatus Chlorobium masyuteum]NTU45479.1 peptidoglycan-associated lipoprotein Pal [Chlorobiaceae bacterium]